MCNNNQELFNSLFITGLVHELKGLEKKGEEGHPFGKNYNPEYSRIREIGEELSELGGISAMREAHRKYYTIYGTCNARSLEYAWDGIGSWRA